MDSPRIVVLGAGCTGLGAAYRLEELGHRGFHVLEAHSYPGGLSASFVDANGFTWDLGGHVQFSHYDYFDGLMNRALPGAWLYHLRRSYVWARQRFIPYPLQSNLRHLPAEDLAACLKGLIAAQRNGHAAPGNFHEWIVQSFGQGIADCFLLPYNCKVWAHRPSAMSYRWVGERVATVDLDRVIDSVILGRDEAEWGPNRTFQFPARGGTGAIWKSVADLIPASRFRYNETVKAIDAGRRVVHTSTGDDYSYDCLISTVPLDILVNLAGETRMREHARGLKHASTHVVGVGLAGQAPEHLASKSWMYFPEDNCPFYRVTVFSNYSPNNVPDASRYWSLMAEVSESAEKPVAGEGLAGLVIQGMIATGLIRRADAIRSVWHSRLERGYPVPSVDRDEHLDCLLRGMEEQSIYSRGRFGAWKYEVGNQDHSCMQGVEVVDRLLLGKAELTIRQPERANAGVRGDAGR